jgi:hypothetical protein
MPADPTPDPEAVSAVRRALADPDPHHQVCAIHFTGSAPEAARQLVELTTRARRAGGSR